MAIKTTTDGWDCVPELKECVEEIENVNNIIYEINNCVGNLTYIL